MKSIQPPEKRLEVSVKMKAWEKLGTKTRVGKIPIGLVPIQLAVYTSADFLRYKKFGGCFWKGPMDEG